jgi:uncharacterized cupin superfamily protein
MLRAIAFEPKGVELEEQPIEPTWIKQGKPLARARIIGESPDGLLTTGVWECTAGTFTWIFYNDEIVHIVEGEVRVRDGATTHVLVPGSVAYFPRGLETVWEVPEYVKKHFVLRMPKVSRLRRVAGAVKQRLVALAARS